MIVVNAFLKRAVIKMVVQLGIGVARGGERGHDPPYF